MKKGEVILGLLVISIFLISMISSAGFVSADNEIAECPEIPESMWCADERTLCPMTTDESGCSVWDCDACEPEPPEPPIEPPCIEAGEETWAGDPNCCEGLKAVSDCLPNQGCPISLRYCVDCGNGKCEAHENWYNCLIDCEQEEPPEKQCNEGEEKYYQCPDGTEVPECICEDEKWVCIISPKENCPDVGPGPEICAARIEVTFNKHVYKIGDPVKIIIEIFDSQGNHLPNYAFYGQMYDDRWHTADLQKTDSKGYFIHTGTAEKPGGGVTEVKFKVYTKETSSCGSVEDTAEVKLELGECGIGGCVPEPECKDKVRRCGGICPPCPEDDEDEEILYPCSGCELENKCYPYGYRKAGDYCLDESETFVSQLEDNAKCENNFECKTNLCISGNCVSSNMWYKFLEWFKKMFGGDDDREPKDCSKLLIEKDIGDNEYEKSGYGENEHSQVPVYSEDGENIETIKCCMADYSEAATMVCEFDSKEDVQNSLKWILAEGKGTEGFSFKEYKGEKVLANGMIVWTSKAYLIVSGGKPEAGDRFVEEIADAYLNKYKSDLEDIEIGDVPPIEPESCEEIEDNTEQADCYIALAIATSDVDVCEKIVYESEHRNKCYVHVAEHTGNADICENVDDSSLREKCYFWVAGQEGDIEVCEEMIDSSLQNECYVEVAEKTRDASFCDKIDDSHVGDKCYRDVGIQTDDRSLCGKIIEDTTKQKCLDNTS